MKKQNTINMKFDNETKKDIDALAFILDVSKQTLCENLIAEGLKPYKDKIVKVKQLKKDVSEK